MIIQVEKETIPDGEWGRACFAPLIKEYKRRMAYENSNKTKEQLYQELTPGQKRLFVLNVYYEHAIESEVELYWWSAYFIAQPKTWKAIKEALVYFGDQNMLHVLNQIENLLCDYPANLESFSVSRDDLTGDEKLLQSIQTIYEKFSRSAPDTNQIISDFIQQKPLEFIGQ